MVDHQVALARTVLAVARAVQQSPIRAYSMPTQVWASRRQRHPAGHRHPPEQNWCRSLERRPVDALWRPVPPLLVLATAVQRERVRGHGLDGRGRLRTGAPHPGGRTTQGMRLCAASISSLHGLFRTRAARCCRHRVNPEAQSSNRAGRSGHALYARSH
eukprot:6110196-Alexandrium_andersonii.AAC.1